MANKEILNELGKTHFGKELKVFLDEELKEIKDVTKQESWEDVVASQKAVRLIQKLFSFLDEKKVDKPTKNQFT